MFLFFLFFCKLVVNIYLCLKNHYTTTKWLKPFRNIIIKDQPVSCPFCLGQCRTQICCKDQEGEGSLPTWLLASIIGGVALVILLVILVLALYLHYKSWKNLKNSRCCKILTCKLKKKQGLRGGRVNPTRPKWNAWQSDFDEIINNKNFNITT